MDGETGPTEKGEPGRESPEEKIPRTMTEGEKAVEEAPGPEPRPKSSFGNAFGWSLAINGFAALYIAITASSLESRDDFLALFLLGAIWLAANAAFIIYYYLKKPKDFQDWIAGIAIGFLISIAVGAVLGWTCFSMV